MDGVAPHSPRAGARLRDGLLRRTARRSAAVTKRVAGREPLPRREHLAEGHRMMHTRPRSGNAGRRLIPLLLSLALVAACGQKSGVAGSDASDVSDESDETEATDSAPTDTAAVDTQPPSTEAGDSTTPPADIGLDRARHGDDCGTGGDHSTGGRGAVRAGGRRHRRRRRQRDRDRYPCPGDGGVADPADELRRRQGHLLEVPRGERSGHAVRSHRAGRVP